MLKKNKDNIKEVEEMSEETTDVVEALKASLKVKGKSSTSAAVKLRERWYGSKQIVWNHLLLYTRNHSEACCSSYKLSKFLLPHCLKGCATST
jgi:hypothetical protein